MIINNLLRKTNVEEAEKEKKTLDVNCKPGKIEANPEYCFNGLKHRKPYINYY
ncbi:MAG: hypothetical protein OdinLCB4_007100 [Candidatus Odinarchaeum yellowstonii]|uniref:Uncharacterized protein n=1 Tax=Odinarchaeota yellowstonii (strain LCB_4) TaxID=1841599 RepID=A0AAF0D214_ODILC|nr:MAG: hypothetical protein OdinLCB4_007100 [Candidatus Odinarchaeum yellowstonii]